MFPRDSKFNEVQYLSDFQRNRVEISIEKVMEQRNFSYTEYEQADVVVEHVAELGGLLSRARGPEGDFS